MENEVMKKVTATALAVALLFWLLVPIPTGLASYDRGRFDKAYAGPEVAVLGVSPAAWAALAGAAGLCFVGATHPEWLQNTVDVGAGFAQFVNENGYVNEYNCDLSQYVDSSGNIDVQAAYAGGFYNMLQAYLVSESAAQVLGNGVNSRDGGTRVFSFNGHEFPACTSVPYAYLTLEQSLCKKAYDQGYSLIGYKYVGNTDTNRERYSFLFAKPKNEIGVSVTLGEDSSGVSARFLGDGASYSYVTCTLDTLNMKFMGGGNYGIGVSLEKLPYAWYEDGSGYSIYQETQVTYNGGVVAAGNGVSPYAGVFTPANVSARISEIASGSVSKVAPFSPTAEQLEAGYDYQTVISNQLSGISTGIEGLDAVLNTILSVLQTIAGIASAPFAWLQGWWNQIVGWWAELLTWVRATPIGQFCADVTSWLGSTPFGHIATTVIDGVQAIPGAVADAGQAVLEGVQAIPGAISGTLEGILEGVQAIPASLSAVIAAVQSGVLDLTGVLDAVMHFFNNGFTPDSLPVVAPPSWSQELEVDLSDKVPFCYVIRAYHAIGAMFGNFSGNRSFYMELEIPYAGVVTMDGEQVLRQPLGGNDIATTIRILATSLLCLGLLYRSYKILERTANSL